MGQTDALDPRDFMRWGKGKREVLWYRCPECMAYLGTVHRIDTENEPDDLICCGECYHANYRRDLIDEWRPDNES